MRPSPIWFAARRAAIRVVPDEEEPYADLTLGERRAVALAGVFRWDLEEIAERERLPLAIVRRRVMRGMRQIRSCGGSDDGTAEPAG